VPFSYAIHKEQLLVLSRGWGYLAYDEAKAHRSNILGDPDFNPTFNQLVDLTATTDDADISGINAQMFAADPFFSPTSRRAAVATSQVIFGLLRQFQAYHGERAQVRVFYDWDSALKWLDIGDVSSQL